MARQADPVLAYAKAVTSGKVVAGPYVRLACKRHMRDLKEGKGRGLEWRPDEALRAIRFYSDVLILEGDRKTAEAAAEAKPFLLLDWQAFVIGSLFGWYRADGFRRFKTAYIETGKGSGKTPLAAGVGLFLMVADGQANPEVYAAATTQDQASICWKDARRMVEAEPELAELMEIQVASLSIPSKNAVFRPVSAEKKGLDGKRVHGAVVDELHEHPTNIVVEKIRAGIKRQQNAIVFEITNSGFDRKSVCWEHHQLSVKVLEGTVENDGWFAYVCALDKGDDWTDRKVWPKANPGLGQVLPYSYLEGQVRDALTMPSKQNIVKRLNFCIWTEQQERWLDMAKWDACNLRPLRWEEFRGRRCFVGFDAASRSDLTAAAFVFPDDEGGFDAFLRFWIPGHSLTIEGAKEIERAEADRLALLAWADQGYITVTQGDVTDYDLVEEQLLAMCAEVELAELVVDRYGITQLITHFRDALGDRVIEFPQHMAGMSPGTKELEKLVVGRNLNHGGNPVLAWMASNVALQHGTAGQIKPVKSGEAQKIDGIVALIQAIDRAQKHPAGGGPSVYEERGMVTL